MVWRSIGLRITDERRREAFLGVFGPGSLLGLLITWLVALDLGWALVWWALRHQFNDIHTFLDAVYFSGISLFTVGFGDVVPTYGVSRMLVLAEAFIGIVAIALLIGYLPTLFGAYSRRGESPPDFGRSLAGENHT